MGYRSEVCFAVNKDLFDKSDIKDLKEFTYAERTETDDAYYFHWSWTKWDSSVDEDAAKIEAFVSEHYDDSALIRIGEDIMDNEFLGNTPDFDIHISRTLDLPPDRREFVGDHKDESSNDDKSEVI